MLEAIARDRIFASVTRQTDLIDLYVSSDHLTGAYGDERPEAQMMRALARDQPPRFLQVVGPAGAGKTSMILRVLADLGRRESRALLRPHEVLVVNVGDAPERLRSAASFMHTVIKLIAYQGHRFASIDPKVLHAAAADERTTTGTQVSHRATLDGKLFSYSAELKETYESAKFGEDPARAREDFEDILSLVSATYRPVIVVDDTEHFVRRGTGGELDVDVDSIAGLFHNGIRALAELDKVDVVVAIHPKYLDVPAVKDITSRFAFEAVHVPALRSDRDDAGLAAILGRRLQRRGLEVPVSDVVAATVISQLEGYYFVNGHDLRTVLNLAADAATAAYDEGARIVEPRHLQPLLEAPTFRR